jgi:hypothetical protein
MWLLYTTFCFGASLIIFSLICQLGFSRNTVFTFIGIGGFFGVFLLLLILNSFGLAVEFWSAILLYSFLCELYIFLFTFVGNSVSVSLIRALAKHRYMSLESIKKLYESDSPAIGRIEKLASVGLLCASESGYSLTAKGKRFIKIFQALRGFFRH